VRIHLLLSRCLAIDSALWLRYNLGEMATSSPVVHFCLLAGEESIRHKLNLDRFRFFHVVVCGVVVCNRVRDYPSEHRVPVKHQQ
jgi:hypothetical protein